MQEERFTSEVSVRPTTSRGSTSPTLSEPTCTTIAKFSVKDRVHGQLPPRPPYILHPESFTYGVVPNPNSSMGITQPSFNNLVMMPNSPASSPAHQVKVPGSSPFTLSNPEENKNPSSAATMSQLPAPGESPSRHPVPFIPETTFSSVSQAPATLPSPVPENSAPSVGNCSYGGISSTTHTDVSPRKDVFGGVRSEPATTSSSQSPANYPAATANLGPPLISTPGLPLLSPYLATPSTRDILAPPGLPVSSAQSLSRPLLPSPPNISSSSLRPIVPTAPLSSNPLFHPQTFPPQHSMPPAVGNSSQALWSPQVGGFSRPQYVPYAPVYPVPFSLAPHGMSPVPLPGSQVSVGGTIPGPVSYNTVSGSQPATIQKDVLPPGIESSKGENGVGKEEITPSINQVEAWSAHRTDSGAVYYYNAVTSESTYEKPVSFKGKDEAIAQPTAVSWEKLSGSDWSLVTTNDGKNYYYNSKTKVSSWQIPLEVAELRKKQETSKQVDNIISDQNNNGLNKVESASSSLSAPALNNGGRDALVLRASTFPGSSTLDLVKKKLQESGFSEADGSKSVEVPAKGLEGENSKDKPKGTNGDGNISESSSDSEDEDGGPTMEERIMQFREMLKEQEVAPFSKWDKELPKIVFDPRFKAIPSYAERRSLFEHYVRTRAEEVRKEKRAAQRAAVEGFKQLLQDANKDIDECTEYQIFRKKWGHDPRFEALERRERELLLNERVHQLKKAAEEKSRAVRAAFKSMLQENEEITSSSRWSRVKESLRDDPRYKAVKHEDREALFKEYISYLKAEFDDAERSGKAEEEKLKERERETRKRKEREEQEMERVKIKVRRKEAIASYQALLMEIIKDPQASWTESRPKLEKDPQRRASNPELDQSDLEKLFRDHTKTLHERCVHEFKALLHEIITPELAKQKTEDGKTAITSWSTAKDILRSDHRYTRMARKDREALWRRHVEQIQRIEKVATENKDEKHFDSKKNSVADTGRLKSASKTANE